MSDSHERDVQEITRLHNVWTEANRKASIAMMREAFVGGDKFFGYNLNGWAYSGIEEWAHLWKFLIGSKARVKLGQDEDLRIQIRGDTAWLTCTADFVISMADGTAIPGSGRFRSTEIYVREDENGNPNWKMWHSHFSWAAPKDQPRMGFDR